MRYIFLVLFAGLVWAVSTSVYMYHDHPHDHEENLEGQTIRRDDVVIDLYKSYAGTDREKIVCYRESHRNFYFFTFLMTIGILGIATYATITRTRLNKKLSDTNALILERNRQIEEQKQALTDSSEKINASLRYSQKLHNTILMSENDLAQVIPDVRVLNEPKDGMGGDFFTAHQVPGGYIIVVGDCTGHGVPGALLSILATTLLNEFIEQREIYDPQILTDELDAAFKKQTQTGDLLDKAEIIALFFDTLNNEFIAASNGGRGVIMVAGEVIPIITGHRQEILPGSQFFLFTDGMCDQLGGSQVKKLLKKNLYRIIQNRYEEDNSPLVWDNLDWLKQELNNWQGEQPQTDDRLLVTFPYYSVQNLLQQDLSWENNSAV